jgi:transcriptional antiterminator NusG
MKKWLVFYTKSRHEKKVRDFLTKRGFNVFLPMQTVMRQWSDRKRKVEVPLFNSYIFVFESEDKIQQILQAPGISWNIRHNDKPAVLRHDEIEIIQRFLSSGFFVETGSAQSLTVGDTVEVIDGALKGLRGSIIHSSAGDKFSILLESIQQNIIVTVDPVALRIIQ